MNAGFSPQKARVTFATLIVCSLFVSARLATGRVPTQVPRETVPDLKDQGKGQRVGNDQTDAERAFAEAEQLAAKSSEVEKQKAIERYLEAYKYWQAAHDLKGQARALYRIAQTYDGMDKVSEAIDYYNQALPIYQSLGDRSAQSETLFNIGSIYNDNGYRRDALKYLNQALPLSQSEGKRKLQGRILNDIGRAYRNLGDAESAFKYYNDALAIWRTEDDQTLLAQTLNNTGWVYLDRGQSSEAVQRFSEALEIRRARKDQEGVAYCLQGIGAAYQEMGELQKAIEQFNEVLKIRRELGDSRNMATALINLGNAYNDFGQYERAIGYLKEAIPLSRQVGDAQREAHALTNVGDTYRKLRDYQQALEYFNQATPLLEKAQAPVDLASLKTSIGLVYSSLGEKEKALAYHTDALHRFQAINYAAGEAKTLMNIAAFYQATGDYREVIEYCIKALSINRKIKAPINEGVTLSYLMSAWKSLNKTQLAIFYGKQAINVYQTIRGNIKDSDKELRQSFLKSKERTYRNLADLLISEGRLPEAQQVINLLKQEEYFDFTRRDGKASLETDKAAYRPDEAKAKEKDDSITAIGRKLAELDARTKQVALTADEERLTGELLKQLESAEHDFQSYLKLLAADIRKPDISGNKVKEAILEEGGLMEDLREIGGDTVVLYTVVGEDKYVVILMTPETRVAREYPIKAADLNKKIADFRDTLQDPQVDPLPLARELYRIIVGPIEKDLEGARSKPGEVLTLMWELDGVLRFVPLAALHDGKNYLVERFRNVVYTPASKSRLKDSARAHWRGLGLGVSKAHSVPDGEFPALPAVPAELREIIRGESAKAAGVLPGRVLLDEAFTLDALKGAHRGYQLLHIASHFQLKPGDETKSFLLLGDGSLFTLAQLRVSPMMFRGVDLLSLSACNTAIGDVDANGSEIEGFGVMAQQQGAKAVLASLWPVADESTKELMKAFYRVREAKLGTSKAEALRLAQLALLHNEGKSSQPTERGLHIKKSVDKTQQRPSAAGQGASKAQYAHPYFWAPFILIGNWK